MRNRLRAFFECALVAAAAAAACPAHADVSALYQTDLAPMAMTIEVNDAGDVRMQMSPGSPMYYLITGGKAYLVERGPTGPYAAELNSYLKIRTESLAGFAGGMKDFERKSGGFPETEFVSLGLTEIRGRTGIGYSMGFKSDKAAKSDKVASHAMLVISDDPQLAPLGAALMRFQQASGQAMAGVFPQFGGLTEGFTKAMGTGTPLRLGPMELAQVDMSAINPARFALPSEPLTEDQLRAMSAPFAPPSAFPEVGKRAAQADKADHIGTSDSAG